MQMAQMMDRGYKKEQDGMEVLWYSSCCIKNAFHVFFLVEALKLSVTNVARIVFIICLLVTVMVTITDSSMVVCNEYDYGHGYR